MDQGFRRAGCFGGIAYALLVTIENLDVLQAPSYDSSVADIVAGYSEPLAKLAIYTVCGTLALAAYLLAAVTLWSVVSHAPSTGDGGGAAAARAAGAAGAADEAADRAADRRTAPWAVLGLAGAAGAAAVGAVAVAAHTLLVLRVDDGLSGDLVQLLHDLRLSLQTLGASPIGLFLVGTALAGRRGGVLPWWLWWSGLAVGVAAVGVSTTGFAGGAVLRAVVLAVLAGATGWLLAASVWLLLRDWAPARSDTPWMTTARVLAGTVAVAAGVAGLALVAFPASTAQFFSWGLAPPPLAALIGGFYLASSAVYGRAAIVSWNEARVMVAGILALTIPVFTATLVHLEIFDFGRLAAWLWVILFAAFPLGAAVALAGQGWPPRQRTAARFQSGARLIAAGIAAALLAVSVALWVDPSGAGDAMLPFTPSPLGGRVLGGWTFLLAVLAGWIAADGGIVTGRLAAWAHVAFPAGAIAGALRSFADLEPAGQRAVYLAVLVVWLALGVVVVADARRARVVPAPATSPSRSRVPAQPRG